MAAEAVAATPWRTTALNTATVETVPVAEAAAVEVVAAAAWTSPPTTLLQLPPPPIPQKRRLPSHTTPSPTDSHPPSTTDERGSGNGNGKGSERGN